MVRTDQDMTFFNDVKNMSRVVDILALHAWIDPETGFCQGFNEPLGLNAFLSIHYLPRI